MLMHLSGPYLVIRSTIKAKMPVPRTQPWHLHFGLDCIFDCEHLSGLQNARLSCGSGQNLEDWSKTCFVTMRLSACIHNCSRFFITDKGVKLHIVQHYQSSYYHVILVLPASDCWHLRLQTLCSRCVPYKYFITSTFHVSHRQREMYCGHTCLCVCLSVCLSAAAWPHCCTDPDVTWGSARFGGFAIGAWVALLWQHNVNPSYKLASISRYDNINQ